MVGRPEPFRGHSVGRRAGQPVEVPDAPLSAVDDVEAAAGTGVGADPDDPDDPLDVDSVVEAPSPDAPAGVVAGVGSAGRDDEPPERLSVL